MDDNKLTRRRLDDLRLSSLVKRISFFRFTLHERRDTYLRRTQRRKTLVQSSLMTPIRTSSENNTFISTMLLPAKKRRLAISTRRRNI